MDGQWAIMFSCKRCDGESTNVHRLQLVHPRMKLPGITCDCKPGQTLQYSMYSGRIRSEHWSFDCPHCGKSCITSFGLYVYEKREDAHYVNIPATLTCNHCKKESKV
jgi:hypothetical protein